MSSIIKYITENLVEIGGVFSVVGSFMVGRKSKKNADISGELNNIKMAREIERSLLKDMKDRIRDLIKTNNGLEVIIEKQSIKLRKYEVKYGVLPSKTEDNE